MEAICCIQTLFEPGPGSKTPTGLAKKFLSEAPSTPAEIIAALIRQNKEIFFFPSNRIFLTWRALLHKLPWKSRLESKKKSNGKKQKRAKKSIKNRKQKIEIWAYIYTQSVNKVKAFDIKSKFLELSFFTLCLKLQTGKNFG
jgi:hypothetical protein